MRVEAEEGSCGRLAVAIDHQHAITLYGEIMREVCCDCAFADTSFEILHRDYCRFIVGGAVR